MLVFIIFSVYFSHNIFCVKIVSHIILLFLDSSDPLTAMLFIGYRER